jgi:hypothetical protein
MKTICEKCKETFEASFKKRTIKHKIELYIQCPSCKKAYHIIYETKETLWIGKEIDNLNMKLTSSKDIIEKTIIENKINNLRNNRAILISKINKS